MVEPKPTGKGELNEAFQKVRDEVLNGLRHGFFECTIKGEILKNQKRQVTIQAGKSHRFIVGEDELPK